LTGTLYMNTTKSFRNLTFIWQHHHLPARQPRLCAFVPFSRYGGQENWSSALPGPTYNLTLKWRQGIWVINLGGLKFSNLLIQMRWQDNHQSAVRRPTKRNDPKPRSVKRCLCPSVCTRPSNFDKGLVSFVYPPNFNLMGTCSLRLIFRTAVLRLISRSITPWVQSGSEYLSKSKKWKIRVFLLFLRYLRYRKNNKNP